MSWPQILYVAGGITALAVAWQKAIWPTICGLHKVVNVIDEIVLVAPILTEIALEFQPNSGTSLRDQIDTINMKIDDLTGQVEAVLTRRPSSRTRRSDVSRTL